jgi:(4-O-methyl)-D-glucuronate---lignin esterase
VGEEVGWRIESSDTNGAPKSYKYTIKKNNLDLVSSGVLDLAAGKASVELKVNEPAMLYLELALQTAGGAQARPIVAGAAVAPSKLLPVASRPADFDAFWAAKIKLLKETPENPVVTSGDAGVANVEYATIRMDNINGSRIHGQLAKPKREGKLPALVIFQWAGPPYPLQKQWVTDHAANGWLTLNIEPHDVLPDQPAAYYQALPESIKHYEWIGNNDRDQSYFLRMYLGDYRAIDYITSHPDWDGKTLVVMGISMGGQQSLCVAGLHPKITHLIVDVPAGCDTNGPLHGRQSSYPNFPSNDPTIMQTALYFDVVNFAPRIRATSLVAMGFVDTISAPAGIWTAFNLIPGSKEAVPMIDSPHNHLATPEQQRPYTERSAEWLNTLVKGEQVTPRDSSAARPKTSTQIDDHQNMMDQLGIKSLRPGADPKNQDIFNEATANQFSSTLPDVLTMNDGTTVTDPAQWRTRRAEILEVFAREVYGRIPKDVPKVTWEITETKNEISGVTPTVTKTLVGHVDNSAYPQVVVDIRASFTVPMNATDPVPMMVAFGGGRFGRNFNRPGNAPGVPWTEQAIAKGWGYGFIDPNSIQADNGSMLRSGIIGLTNKGGPRKPDDWGALRAWQWGVSRLIDYFEANPDSKVDATKVGIEGVSRFGKAALVTEAFDERVAVGVIASSGAGGAKLYRHIFGETVENLAGGEYYWMAGNFMKYAAAESESGPRTTADLPIDSHELIAACAPRPCFISYGTEEHGDPKWVDARGSFMAGVLASPVYELLGKKGFGMTQDYRAAPLPPVGQLIGGELAWRQHDGGHEMTPNWPTFFEWISRYIEAPSVAPSSTSSNTPKVESVELADSRSKGAKPLERTDANSKLAHQQLLDKARRGGIDVYFVGDSITRRWGCTDPQYASFLQNWKSNFFGWNAANFGWGGDTTQNILWRLANGELDNVNPKVIVILAGTNDLNPASTADEDVAETTNGLRAIISLCQQKAPSATIILTAIFPRNDHTDLIPRINQINANIARFADGQRIRFLNVNDKLADMDGKLFDDVTVDKLHPTLKGYQFWAAGLKPILTEILGPPATTDHAPPPTGDQSTK